MAALLALSVTVTVVTCIYHLQWRKRHSTRTNSQQNAEDVYEEVVQPAAMALRENKSYGQNSHPFK